MRLRLSLACETTQNPCLAPSGLTLSTPCVALSSAPHMTVAGTSTVLLNADYLDTVCIPFMSPCMSPKQALLSFGARLLLCGPKRRTCNLLHISCALASTPPTASRCVRRRRQSWLLLCVYLRTLRIGPSKAFPREQLKRISLLGLFICSCAL